MIGLCLSVKDECSFRNREGEPQRERKIAKYQGTFLNVGKTGGKEAIAPKFNKFPDQLCF